MTDKDLDSLSLIVLFDFCFSALQASQLEPDPQEIAKFAVFSQALAAKRSPLAGGGEDTCLALKKFVTTWTLLIDKLLTLVSSNQKCVQICTGNIQEHLQQHGEKLLKTVVGARKEVNRLLKQLETLAQGITFRSPDLERFLGDRLPDSFLSEMQCEAFDDMVSYLGTVLIEKIRETNGECTKHLADHFESRQLGACPPNHLESLSTSWKAGLTDSSSFGDILEKSKAVVSVVPARYLKEFTNKITEETVGSGVTLFDSQ